MVGGLPNAGRGFFAGPAGAKPVHSALLEANRLYYLCRLDYIGRAGRKKEADRWMYSPQRKLAIFPR